MIRWQTSHVTKQWHRTVYSTRERPRGVTNKRYGNVNAPSEIPWPGCHGGEKIELDNVENDLNGGNNGKAPRCDWNG